MKGTLDQKVMVRVRGETSNHTSRSSSERSRRGSATKMVRLAEPSLNQFIDVLAEWDSELKALNVPELNDPGMEP
ncbi:MAG: hypothetical protein L3J04_08555 [Robiginitomaculum sp.]|nr:hypothetical protein [Robiginitomaculum sp.]